MLLCRSVSILLAFQRTTLRHFQTPAISRHATLHRAIHRSAHLASLPHSNPSIIISATILRDGRGMSTSLDEVVDAHVDHITRSLQSKAQPPKKQWWENYLKQAIEFYGVPMADIRTSVNKWVESENPSDHTKKQTAWSLFRQPIAEQKLAAILSFQNHVYMSVEDLSTLKDLFRENYIYDWNTTDWLCVRVLGPLVTREGESAIDVFKLWVEDTDGNPLWQRRAALVAFVDITKAHSDPVLEIADTLAQDSERFAQTAIGWTLRNLSLSHASEVVDFLKRNKESLSSEAINMASAKMSDHNRKLICITGKRKRR